MAIQRAVVYGHLLDLVETRSMFTADVVVSGGDTADVLWDAYLNSVYDPWENLTASTTLVEQAELQNLSAGQWVTFDQIPMSHVGVEGNPVLANAVSIVLIGKALGLRKMGRKFISGLTEGIVVGNGIATLALIQAAAVLLAYITPFTGLGGGTITPGIVDATGTFHPFVGGVVSSILGSMRRRKPGVGF